MSLRYALAPLAGTLFAASVVFAQGPDISFPIAELGGCAAKEECKVYCDAPENGERCFAFAEARGLMSREEAAQARKFHDQTGPGGCRGSECRSYCSDLAHRAECMAFAREHGLEPPGPSREEIEARIREQTGFRPEMEEPNIDEEKAMRIVEEEGGPGGCRTKDECHAYCEVPDNMEQCFAFAAEHGLMSEADLARARTMMSQDGPGGCRGLECRAYCENPDHAEECLAFAEEQGFMPREEVERVRKMMNAVGPGGCRGIECKRRCEDPAYQKECFEFAVENGLIPPEEAARMREFMESGGPGGCSSREECERLCRENPTECGMRMPDGEFEGEGGFPINFDGPRDRREQFEGPGGCRGPEECRTYCEAHPDECRGFGPPPGDGRDFGQERAMEMRGFEMPPGMPCSTPEECHRLFEENPEAFKHMGPGDPMSPQGIPPEFDRRQEEYHQQFEAHYQEKFEDYQQYQGGPYPPEGMHQPVPGQWEYPSEDYVPQPGGTYQPPSDGDRWPDGAYPPPSDGGYPPPDTAYQPPPDGAYQEPPPDSAPPPTSLGPTERFVASVFSVISRLLGR